MYNVIALWTHPRSISTAFERIMIERKDFTILHEPFSYHYYVNKDNSAIEQEYVDPEHPMAYPDIRNHIIDTGSQAPVFFKDMSAHCCDELLNDTDFLNRIENTFLIRNPELAIPSYYAMHNEVTPEEIGLKQLFKTFETVMENTETVPMVIDASDLENDPEGIMAAYCKGLNIPFIPEAMTWEESHQEEWDIWKEWHTDAAQSTGIKKNMEVFEVDVENSDHLKQLYDVQYPFYEKLYQYRIQPVSPSDVNSTCSPPDPSIG